MDWLEHWWFTWTTTRATATTRKPGAGRLLESEHVDQEQLKFLSSFTLDGQKTHWC